MEKIIVETLEWMEDVMNSELHLIDWADAEEPPARVDLRKLAKLLADSINNSENVSGDQG